MSELNDWHRRVDRSMKSCIKHKRQFRTKCKQCLEQNARQSEATAYARQTLYNKAAKDRSKHQNETCSNCDRPLDFDEWFCYCSLCPDCYLQTPESEIEELDKRIKELTASGSSR